MTNIGIVCEGPTDYIILKEVIDKITQNHNYYVQLQPEPDLLGEYGNGWKASGSGAATMERKKKRLL